MSAGARCRQAQISRIGQDRGVRCVRIYGGKPIEQQFEELRRGPNAVVGTPGRILDHLRRGTLAGGGQVLEGRQPPDHRRGSQGGVAQGQEGGELGGVLPLAGLELRHPGDQVSVLGLQLRVGVDGFGAAPCMRGRA